MTKEFNDKVLNLKNSKDQIFLLKNIALVGMVFLISYTLPNKLAYLQSGRLFRMYTQWELNAPLIPEFIFIYFSTYIQIVAPIFTATKKQVHYYARAIIIASIIAGVVFVLFPSELGFDRDEYIPRFAALFKFLHIVDDPHNMFPSLHVGYSTITTLVLLDTMKNKLWKRLLCVWQLFVYSSIIFVHQHHIFDFLTGFPLALLCFAYYHQNTHPEIDFKKKLTLILSKV